VDVVLVVLIYALGQTEDYLLRSHGWVGTGSIMQAGLQSRRTRPGTTSGAAATCNRTAKWITWGSVLKRNGCGTCLGVVWINFKILHVCHWQSCEMLATRTQPTCACLSLVLPLAGRLRTTSLSVCSCAAPGWLMLWTTGGL
jgi:hypothetical protein